MADAATIEALTAATTFTQEEINTMYANFRESVAQHADSQPGIHRQAFLSIVGSESDPESHFVNAIFSILSGDKERFDFVEFAKAVAIYQRRVRDVPEIERQRLLFKFYDVDNDGHISQDDLKKVLASCFAANQMTVREDDIAKLVTNTFAKYKSGTIDLETYSKQAFAHKSSYC